MAYLIDEKLQLKNSSSALMLTVAVHPRSAQSGDTTESRKSTKPSFCGCAHSSRQWVQGTQRGHPISTQAWSRYDDEPKHQVYLQTQQQHTSRFNCWAAAQTEVQHRIKGFGLTVVSVPGGVCAVWNKDNTKNSWVVWLFTWKHI